MDQFQNAKIKRLFDTDIDQCPCCQKGKLVTIYGWTQARAPPDLEKAIVQAIANQ